MNATDPATAHKWDRLHAGIQFLASEFGSATPEDFGREFGADGQHIAAGLVSQGWASPRNRHGDYVITEAGQRADRATSPLYRQPEPPAAPEPEPRR